MSIVGYVALGFLSCLTLLALCACALSSQISQQEERVVSRWLDDEDGEAE